MGRDRGKVKEREESKKKKTIKKIARERQVSNAWRMFDLRTRE